MKLRLSLVGLCFSVIAGCGGGGGGGNPPPGGGTPPAVTLTASQSSVPAGTAVTLTWSTNDAQSCTASGGWTGSRPTGGNEQVTPTGTSTTYTLSCSGTGGSTQRSVTVSVLAAPGLTLSANPTSVTSGQSSTLTWTSTDATSCTASGGWSGSKAVSGSESVGPLSTTTNFTLACTGAGGNVQRSVSVTVNAPPPTSGLDARPSNTTCIAPDRPTTTATIGLTRVFPALSFASPVALLQAPGDASRWFVIEQAGRIMTFANVANPASAATFIDIRSRVLSGGEQGLLGMAFDPAFASNGRVYLSYTAGSPRRSILSRFRSLDGGQTLNATTEEVLLSVPQPFSNHNGGHIAFGPDGYLYFGIGDGGDGGDPQNNAQTLTNLLGAILRIDVNGAAPYGIPGGNPFAANPRCSSGPGTAPCPEIYAWGLRNPWRWSFDRATGELWAGDVGQSAREEISVIRAGGNYGWRYREGTLCYNPSSNCPTAGPGGEPLIGPVAEYGRSVGQSVTGGYVYRGSAIPALVGRYVFGDFSTGRLFVHRPDPVPLQAYETLLQSGLNVASFGEGVDGEVYVVHYGGTLHRLVQTGGGGSDPVPDDLAATGCTSTTDVRQPAPGLIPYAPNAPFWSDGAEKQRWIGLPNGATVSIGSDGDFEFPNGTVLVKSFRLQSRLIETRLFMRHPDGEWAGYTYRWNDPQTAATRVRGGLVADVGGQDWTFPSEVQCLQCHTAAAGRSLGLEAAQLNGNLQYPATGRTANQLTTLDTIGVFSPRLSPPAAQQPALANPYGGAGTLEQRARAYLHTNCANCHRPGGPTPTTLDLRFQTAVAATNTCNVTPQAGNLGVADARIIAPGAPDRSVLVLRTDRRDAAGMPPLASHVVDAQGVQLLRQWISQLGGC